MALTSFSRSHKDLNILEIFTKNDTFLEPLTGFHTNFLRYTFWTTPGVEYLLVTLVKSQLTKGNFYLKVEMFHEPMDGYSSYFHGYIIMTGLGQVKFLVTLPHFRGHSLIHVYRNL